MDIVEGRTRRRQMGNCEHPDPKRPRKHTGECICYISYLLSKYSHGYVFPSTITGRVTAITRLQVPQNKTVFSPKCTKVHKIRQNSQKRSKIG